VGKTTLLQEALSRVRGKAGGFYTREIRRRGIREGFEIVTLEGQSAVLAHVSFRRSPRVSKYGVDVENLERVAVPALRQAARECDIVVIDEIGKMELFSSAFREAVQEALASNKKVVGTIMLSPHPWADQLKSRPEVKVIRLSRANRQQVLQELLSWLENEGRKEEAAQE
jgi:nucleoside-triphosphatase